MSLTMPSDLLHAIEAEKHGEGPLTPPERVELHELELVLASRQRLGLLNAARLAHLRGRANARDSVTNHVHA